MSGFGFADGWEHNQADRQNSTSSADVETDSPETCTQTTGDGKANENSKAPPPSDKTISCVSCRRRKLKCDRVKPRCGTCIRLRHDCEFPERKRNLGSKRRNMKELEARLAQVETQLVSETKMAAAIEPLSAFGTEPDWNAISMDVDVTLDVGMGAFNDPAFDISPNGFEIQNPLGSMDGFFSQELLALGLQEPLPPPDMVEELNEIYFRTFHQTMPVMQKYKYYAAFDRAPHMRPPVCLRYAMWTIAASITESYNWFEDLAYERTRRYLQQDEMKGHGENFVSIYHVQAWALIATYEATKTYFSRSWMSSGRAVRLCHMLGLHRLDGDAVELKRILPPAKDWLELEERRRAFWAAFYVDRWASSGTGWPMLIDEREIQTNLPSSEDAFASGVQQVAISLEEALTPEGASKVSPFGGIILSATLFGHNFQHLHRTGPNERPDDLANGEFWKRHRKMDNVLTNTFMFLPDHLRLPSGIGDMNVPLIHMNIHASAICLHQAAILTAEKHKLDPNFKRQCQSRSVSAAEEVVNIMKMISHVDVSLLSSWTGFCLYVAAGVLVQDKKLHMDRTLNSLDFLLFAMKALAKKHSITNHFIAQLELDIDAAGIRNGTSGSARPAQFNIPINGIIEELQSHCDPSRSAQERSGSSDDSGNYHPLGVTPLMRLPASSREPQDAEKEQNTMVIPNMCGTTVVPKSYASAGAAVFPSDSGPSSRNTEYCPYDNNYDSSSHGKTDDTPPSDSSTPNTTQYPIRQASTTNANTLPGDHFTADSASFTSLVDFRATYNSDQFMKPRPEGRGLEAFLEDQMWGHEKQ